MSKLSEIKARLAAATPGPWSIEEHGTGETLFSYVAGENFHPLNLISFDDPDAKWPKNKALIANAPADMAWLVAELERAQACIEKVVKSGDILEEDGDMEGAIAALADALDEYARGSKP